jgi:hypothetical protein
MSLTVTAIKGLAVEGDLWYTVNDVTLDNSYAEGGEALTLRELGFGIEAVYSHSAIDVKNLSEAEATTVGPISYDGSKIHVSDYKTQKEMAKEKDLSKVKLRIKTFCSSP